MSGKLDQSLDEILSTTRRTAGRPARNNRRVRRAPQTGKATVAPVGGVKKTVPKQGKGAVKSVPTGPSGGSGESRIQVSNLVSNEHAIAILTNLG